MTTASSAGTIDRIRSWIQVHPRLTATFITSILLAILIYASASMWWKTNPAKQIPMSFIDEETGALTAGTFADVPPMIGVGGRPTVVRAIFYTCAGATERKIAFYKKYTDEAKAQLEDALKKDKTALPISVMMVTDRQCLVRLPDKGAPWVPIDSAEGLKVIQNFDCAGGLEAVRPAP